MNHGGDKKKKYSANSSQLYVYPQNTKSEKRLENEF